MFSAKSCRRLFNVLQRIKYFAERREYQKNYPAI